MNYILLLEIKSRQAYLREIANPHSAQPPRTAPRRHK